MRNSSLTQKPRQAHARALAIPAINISPIRALTGIIGLLIVAYVALMAFTMTYAVIHTEYAQQSRDAEAQVGTLETQYFNAVAQVDSVDPTALGYVQPASQHFALMPSAPTVAIAQ